MAIRYIRQKDINYSLWDRCITNSLNGLVYAHSWYLDIVAEQWDALVEDDYRSVMPLIYQKKLFYKKTFTPFLSRQLGIFSMNPITNSKIETFLNAIPNEFKYMDICFNRQNSQSIRNLKKCKSLKSYELDLIVPYERKSGLYNSTVLSNLAFAAKNKLSIIKGLSLEEFKRFVAHFETKISHNILLNPLLQIMSLLTGTGKGEIVSVYSSENVLISIACFVRSNQNVILLYALSNSQGVDTKADYLILDYFLKNYSSRNVTLSLDHFDNIWNEILYRNFDALESFYLCHSENRLPSILQWF